MAHIDNLSTGVFSSLAVAVGTTIVPATWDDAGFKALFATADTGTAIDTAVAGGFLLIPNVRDFPAMGAPANIVRVPVFGSKQSKQVKGQSDAPSLEITVNFVASEWNGDDNADGSLNSLVGNQTVRAFRFAVMAEDSKGATTATKYASVALGLGTVKNSCWYWTGRIESMMVKPSLSDATTATLSLSMQSDFYGSYTY